MLGLIIRTALFVLGTVLVIVVPTILLARRFCRSRLLRTTLVASACLLAMCINGTVLYGVVTIWNLPDRVHGYLDARHDIAQGHYKEL